MRKIEGRRRRGQQRIRWLDGLRKNNNKKRDETLKNIN